MRAVPTGENAVGHGVHPHPNLPPSRGKGIADSERAILIGVTGRGTGKMGGDPASARTRGWRGRIASRSDRLEDRVILLADEFWGCFVEEGVDAAAAVLCGLEDEAEVGFKV